MKILLILLKYLLLKLLSTLFPTFPHGGRSESFPLGGKKKGGKNKKRKHEIN
jgi:hypothetical protein